MNILNPSNRKVTNFEVISKKNISNVSGLEYEIIKKNISKIKQM